MTVEVRRGTHRFLTREEGRSTHHSFSFGSSYDPGNTRFGPLVCHDDHLLRAGSGFEDHEHRDVEVVTWVLTGAVVHESATGGRGVVAPGEVQVLWAGAGVTHREVADEGVGPTRFVQAWLQPGPDDAPAEPAYSRAAVDVAPGALVPVASASDPDAPVRLVTPGATLLVARLGAGDAVTLPDHPRQHVFVARGALARSSLAEPLAAGDAFRITDRPGLLLTAAAPTELLVWVFD